MELRNIRFFVGVADELHFGRAAERMYIAQPALSQHIRRLERELGVLLFDRSKRQVRLTPAGSAFYDEARRLLDSADRAKGVARRAANGEAGTLSVGMVPALCGPVVTHLMERFRSCWPRITLEVQPFEPIPLEQALTAGRISLGLSDSPTAATGSRLVTSEPLVCVLPRGHNLTLARHVSLAALANEPFVMPRRRLNPRLHDAIVACCNAAGFTPLIVHESDSGSGVAISVASGVGVSLVPRPLGERWEPVLTCRPLSSDAPEVDVVALWRDNDSTPHVKAFVETIGDLDSAHIEALPACA